MRINYDFGDLEAFLVVMETQSFHLAGDRLNLSQSAVTRRIQKLEEALGCVLFERSTRQVKPTLAAKRFLGSAETMLENARETLRAMRDDSVAHVSQRHMVVTVAVIPTVMSAVLEPPLRKVQDDGHQFRLRILDRASNEVVEAVSSGEADFGIGSIGALDPGTEFETFLEDELGVFLPFSHALAEKNEIEWKELEDCDLILPARGTGNRLLIDETLARVGLSAYWAFEVERTTTAVELVRHGKGVAVLPKSSADLATANDLHFVPLVKPIISRPIGLLSRSGAADRPLVSAFKEAIRGRLVRSAPK
ncbi:LysR family transcriptional regulator [Roseibium sp. TrichSKD4]|uniref:LysR family transcriptional regulator n=1 Tax=Roseibium sp. TrichSKD4 TaxID=744980 RepID=UPI0001E56DF6|nr:LysR family transcriptional regulator [Roseibium sp. TrichSKD4]EFO31997.1 LysR family transcriptional regulator [Roseibium sp. TrichSKD4]